MKTINKVFFRFFSTVTIGIFLISFSYASSDNQKIALKFNDQTMSADLEHVALGQILEQIKSEKGIWFEAYKSVLEKKISVSFENLKLEEGVRRILADVGHALLFDEDKRLSGIIVIGENNSKALSALNADRYNKKTPDENPFVGFTDQKNPFRILQKALKNQRGLLHPKGDQGTELNNIEEIRQIFESAKNRLTEQLQQSSGDKTAEGSLQSTDNPFSAKDSSGTEKVISNPFFPLFGSNPKSLQTE
jgi:hypothetical protein